MSVPLYLRARDCNGLSPTDKAVLKEMAFIADEQGGNVYPKVETLALYLGLGERTVQKALRSLEEKMRIRRIGSGKGGRDLSTRYQILLDQLPESKKVNVVHPLESEKGESSPQNGEPGAEKGARGSQKGERGAPERLERLNTKTVREKPSAETATADPRHSEIREHIQTCFIEWTKLPTAPWNGRDAKALDTFLKANPSWEVETIKTLVTNRFDSEVNQADPAYTWLPQLQKYALPLDRWGRPVKPQGYSEGLKYTPTEKIPKKWKVIPDPENQQREASPPHVEVNRPAKEQLKSEERYGMAEVAAMFQGLDAKKRLQ
jgi:hypothetical protein